MSGMDQKRYEDENFDRGEAEMLEQVSLVTGEPTVDLTDVGPPAPGEGDDLPNPEIGMEC
jgi:hypothetical protein